MKKNIDRAQRIVYMPLRPDEKIVNNITRKKQIFVDENYKYCKPKFIAFWQWFIYYFFAKPVFYLYGKIIFGIKVKGKKNIKNIKTGAITVSNHVHYLDFSIATTFIGKWKRNHVVSNKENFDVPIAGKLISAYGALPLPDTPKATINFYKQISTYLGKKRFIHIYPEAAMWPYYTKLRPFQSGAFHLACTNSVPIIPYVVIFRKSKGFAKLIRKRPRITVVICNPLFPNQQLGKKQQITDLCERTHASMQKVFDEHQSYEFYKYVADNREQINKKSTI